MGFFYHFSLFVQAYITSVFKDLNWTVETVS